jgi:hypothetical protein
MKRNLRPHGCIPECPLSTHYVSANKMIQVKFIKNRLRSNIIKKLSSLIKLRGGLSMQPIISRQYHKLSL